MREEKRKKKKKRNITVIATDFATQKKPRKIRAPFRRYPKVNHCFQIHSELYQFPPSGKLAHQREVVQVCASKALNGASQKQLKHDDMIEQSNSNHFFS